MKDILLIVIMLAFFVFGFYVIGRAGRFMDKNFRRVQEPKKTDRQVFIAKTGGKSAIEVSKEVNTILDMFQDSDDYEIIICRKIDPDIIEYLKRTGCTVRYGIHG